METLENILFRNSGDRQCQIRIARVKTQVERRKAERARILTKAFRKAYENTPKAFAGLGVSAQEAVEGFRRFNELITKNMQKHSVEP